MNIEIYFQAIRHEKLNQPGKPCERDPNYNFGQCVERTIMTRAGCQPPWSRTDLHGLLPLCDNWSLLTRYHNERYRLWLMDNENLINDTKCLMPCIFMEYKVLIHLL